MLIVFHLQRRNYLSSILIFVPSSTPAGIVTDIVFCFFTWPVPEHFMHGFIILSPISVRSIRRNSARVAIGAPSSFGRQTRTMLGASAFVPKPIDLAALSVRIGQGPVMANPAPQRPRVEFTRSMIAGKHAGVSTSWLMSTQHVLWSLEWFDGAAATSSILRQLPDS